MAAFPQVIRSLPHNYMILPFTGAGGNIAAGAVVIAGSTDGTNTGVAINGGTDAGASGKPIVGFLNDKHVFATSGDATTATLVNWFAPYGGTTDATAPSHKVELLMNATIAQMDYDLTSTVAVASATSTVLTITSAEAALDGGFVYVNAGVGIGQLCFIASSTTSDLTVSSAMGTTCTSTSKLTKILRHFHRLPVFVAATTTAPTLLNSTAAVGTGRAVNLGSYIVRNGLIDRLDPKAFHNTTGLNSISSLRFFSHLQFQNTVFSANS